MAVESGPLMHAAIAAIYCMRPFSLFIHPAAIFIVQGLFKKKNISSVKQAWNLNIVEYLQNYFRFSDFHNLEMLSSKKCA